MKPYLWGNPARTERAKTIRLVLSFRLNRPFYVLFLLLSPLPTPYLVPGPLIPFHLPLLLSEPDRGSPVNSGEVNLKGNVHRGFFSQSSVSTRLSFFHSGVRVGLDCGPIPTSLEVTRHRSVLRRS